MNGTEIVTGTETRDILGLIKNRRRKNLDREAERGTEIETGESVNAANPQNHTRHHIRIKIETEIVTEGMIGKGREKEKGKETEIGEESATELDIKICQCERYLVKCYLRVQIG